MEIARSRYTLMMRPNKVETAVPLFHMVIQFIKFICFFNLYNPYLIINENISLKLSEFLRQNLMIFIIKGFQTIVSIFIVISTMFWPICPPTFFRCLSNSGTYIELRATSFIESVGITCSDSISHN